MKRSVLPYALLIPCWCFCSSSLADDYLNETRTFAAPTSTTERFTFSIDSASLYPNYELRIQMSQGRAQMRILDPYGRLVQDIGAQDCTLSLQPIPAART